MESRPFVTTFPDQAMILIEQTKPNDYIEALCCDGFAMVYTPTGKKFELRLVRIKAKILRAWFWMIRQKSSLNRAVQIK